MKRGFFAQKRKKKNYEKTNCELFDNRRISKC
jgi:hypothetical protein